MSKTKLKSAGGIFIIFLAALLMSVNHNVAPDNRIPSLIIVAMFAIGGGLLSFGHVRK